MRRDPAYLLDMLLAAQDVLDFMDGLSREKFGHSELLQSAVARKLEILGEASNRLTKETRNAHPEIPWKSIVATRNKLIHGYFDVDLDEVWSIVKDDLPGLIAVLKTLVPPPNS